MRRSRPLIKASDALVIPAVGPKLAPDLFEGARLKLVQVTGAGVDRLDQAAMTRLGIPVANVPGGSNGAVAEYAVTTASMLLRRFAWADAEIKAGNYAKFRARMLADNLAGHRRAAGRACRLRHHRPRGGAGASGAWARSSASTIRPPVDAAVAAALDARPVPLDELLATCRRGHAACAAAPGDAESDRRGRARRA